MLDTPPRSLAAAYLQSVEAGEGLPQTSSGRAACLIARLTAEGRLAERQFMAGARFREAHHKASMGFKLTHAWPKAMAGRLQPAWRTPDSEATMRHQRRYEAFLGALPPLLAVAAITMAIHDRRPMDYGVAVFKYREHHAAKAAGLVSLIHALDVLSLSDFGGNHNSVIGENTY